MTVILPARAGCLAALIATGAARRSRPGPLTVLARGWAEAMVERERRATLATVLSRVPPGWCVVDRGRERFVGPAAAMESARGALR